MSLTEAILVGVKQCSTVCDLQFPNVCQLLILPILVPFLVLELESPRSHPPAPHPPQHTYKVWFTNLLAALNPIKLANKINHENSA